MKDGSQSSLLYNQPNGGGKHAILDVEASDGVYFNLRYNGQDQETIQVLKGSVYVLWKQGGGGVLQ